MVSSAAKMTIVFEGQQYYRLVLLHATENWANGSQEIAACLGLELQILAGIHDIWPRCFCLGSFATKLMIVFEEQQRYRLLLLNTKENGANGHLPAEKWPP